MRYRTKRLLTAILPVVVLSVTLVLGLSSALAFAGDAEEPVTAEENAVPEAPVTPDTLKGAEASGAQALADTLDPQDAPKASTAYPVWLNNVQVNESNKDDILHNGKASYDPVSKTLTLKNITLNGATSGGEDYTRAIVNAEYQDLNLVCTNVTLHNTNNTCPAIDILGGSLTISGTLTARADWDRAIDVYDGSVTINGDVTAITTSSSYQGFYSEETAIYASNGITVNGKLTAEGTAYGLDGHEGDITLTGGPISITGGKDEAIYTSGTVSISCDVTLVSNGDDAISASTIVIESGTVKATSYDDGNGLHATTITINGGTVTATGPDNGIDADYLTVNGGTVEASCDRYEGIDVEEITINGGTVTGTSQHDPGIQGSNITINGGTVTGTAGDGDEAGIYAFETIKIGNGITKVIASGIEGAIAIYGREGLTLGKSVAIVQPEGGSVQTQVETSDGDIFYTIKEADKATVATYVELTSDAVPCTLTFDLAGGTLDGQTGSVTFDVYTTDDFTIPDGPTLDDFVFKYWTDGEDYLDGTSVAGDGSPADATGAVGTAGAAGAVGAAGASSAAGAASASQADDILPAEDKGAKYYPGNNYVVDGDHAFTAVFEEATPSGGDDPGEDPDDDSQGGGSGGSGGQSSTPGTGDDLSPFTLMVTAVVLGMLLLLGMSAIRSGAERLRRVR